MSTQYGNFLYQVEAKQFPGRTQAQNRQQEQLFEFKNQLLMKNKNSLNFQNLDPKQI